MALAASVGVLAGSREVFTVLGVLAVAALLLLFFGQVTAEAPLAGLLLLFYNERLGSVVVWSSTGRSDIPEVTPSTGELGREGSGDWTAEETAESTASEWSLWRRKSEALRKKLGR